MPGVERTRREAIKRGLALIGAAGTGALLVDASPAGAAERGDTSPHGANPSDTSGPTTTGPGATPDDHSNGHRNRLFTGAGLDVSAPDFVRGTLPPAGQRLLITGNLLDSGGNTVGQVLGTYLQLLDFGSAGPTDPVSVQDEVLTFFEGTICARGLARADLGAPITFAITGGTGKYAGAKGTYTAVQRFLSLGGDGSARFDLSTSSEASDHGS